MTTKRQQRFFNNWVKRLVFDNNIVPEVLFNNVLMNKGIDPNGYEIEYRQGDLKTIYNGLLGSRKRVVEPISKIAYYNIIKSLESRLLTPKLIKRILYRYDTDEFIEMTINEKHIETKFAPSEKEAIENIFYQYGIHLIKAMRQFLLIREYVKDGANYINDFHLFYGNEFENLLGSDYEDGLNVGYHNALIRTAIIPYIDMDYLSQCRSDKEEDYYNLTNRLLNKEIPNNIKKLIKENNEYKINSAKDLFRTFRANVFIRAINIALANLIIIENFNDPETQEFINE